MNITFKKLEKAIEFVQTNDIYNKRVLFIGGKSPKWRFSFTSYHNTYFFVTSSLLESRLFRSEFFK